MKITEKYAHLRADLFGEKHRTRLAVDFSTPTGKVIPLSAPKEVHPGAAWVQPEKASSEKTG